MATFKDFPTNMVQTPEMFTRAGFYYSGISDHVKCFFCDGGLRNWEPNDDPWTEHARWFPRCGFLRLCKGDEFIQQVKDKFAPPTQLMPPRMRMRHNLKNELKPVDNTKLNRYMNDRIVKGVMDMGYEEEKVKQVVIRRMQDLGEDFFPNIESLLDAIIEYDEELKYLDVYGEPSSEECEHQIEVNNDEAPQDSSKKKKHKKRKKNKKPKEGQPETKNDTVNVVGKSEPLEYIDEEEVKHMSEDVQRMKDERLCKVCLDEEANIVFLKCGHLVCCSNCAPVMRHCPICRQTIRGTIRVFIS